MTFEDERTRTAGQSVAHVAEWLELALGPRLAAFAVGVTAGDICRFAHGDEPAAEVEQRLRNLYRATWFMAATDGPGTAHDWLIAPQVELDDRAPAELLREGESPAPVWFSVAPAF
jgi:hypothetical protein